MNAVILNLTRIGDIVQSTPLMMGLKEKGYHITYVANTPYADICKGIPFIDDLITFDMGAYQARILAEETSLVEDFRFLESFVCRINRRRYDLLISLTPSRICSVITSLVNAEEIRGLTIDTEGHRVIKDPWMRYFTISVFNRNLNPFNLVDMYIKAGGVKRSHGSLYLDLPAPCDGEVTGLLENHGIAGDELVIGLQPGASKEHKRWSASGYGELGRILSERLGARIVVFGSKSEQALCDEVSSRAGVGVVNLGGRTSLMELPALLKRCRILVSNDSGTMHIASAVGVRVIELSLGAAFFRETGPYGDGHMVMEADIPCHPCNFNVDCKEMICRERIKPEDVFELVSYLVNEEKDCSAIGKMDGVNVYVSNFDEDGMLEYVPLKKVSSEINLFFLQIYREMWKLFLAGDIVTDISGQNDLIYKVSDKLVASGSKLDNKDLRRSLTSMERLVGLADKGLNLSISLRNHSVRQSKELAFLQSVSMQLTKVENEIEHVGFMCPFVKPIVQMFLYEKEAIDGDDLSTASRAYVGLYRNIVARSSFVCRLIRCMEDGDGVLKTTVN